MKLIINKYSIAPHVSENELFSSDSEPLFCDSGLNPNYYLSGEEADDSFVDERKNKLVRDVLTNDNEKSKCS